jgi:hypothetical protein
MDYNASRLFAMTLAHRAVGDMRRDGFRQLRNYVDMCEVLSNNPMQKTFFQRAQTVLEKTDSLYYSLIQRLIETTDEERSCTVGVNFGLGALVYGAGRLKQEAQETKKEVSWMTVSSENDTGLEQAVSEGEKHGSYVWALWAPHGISDRFIQLAALHPLGTFFLVVDPMVVTPEICQKIVPVLNLVPILLLEQLEITETALHAAELLHRNRMLYSFLVRLDNENAGRAMNAEWLDVLAQSTLFCVYCRKKGMDPKISNRLMKEIYRSRTASGAPLLLLDWENDTRVLNAHISSYAVIGMRMPDEQENPLNF